MRGSLRIYLGAAPGVGKTFAMLREGNRLRREGADVVAGLIETHGRAETAAEIGDLELIPRRPVGYRGNTFGELDVDAVLARAPSLVLVDELAHTNVPGSARTKRWEDIDVLLDAGIDVFSTLNIQHLESLNDVVERITGIRQRETVPDGWVRQADQIELVDLPPEVLRRRLAEGRVYPFERVDVALGNYFRPGNLGALRELALMWVADRVGDELDDYLAAHGLAGGWETRERVLVGITGAPWGEQLVRRAGRLAERSRGRLIGVHVRSDAGLVDAPSLRLEQNRQLLADLGGSYVEVVGSDVADALLRTARAERATQIVLGATRRTRWERLWGGSVIERVLHHSGPIDVHVIRPHTAGEPDDDGETEQPATSGRPQPPPARGEPLIPARRRRLAWLVVVLGLVALTGALSTVRGAEGTVAELSLYLLVVVVAALLGGALPAVVASVAGFVAGSWFLVPPYGTLAVGEVEDLVGLVSFVTVGVVVGTLVGRVARRSAEAARAYAAADALARSAADLAVDPDPVPSLLELVRTTFNQRTVELRVDGATPLVLTAGPAPGAQPDGQRLELTVAAHATLLVEGPALSAQDRAVLDGFAAQLGAALEQSRLRRAAGRAGAAEEAERFRATLLRAAAHDLRGPLLAIRRAVAAAAQADDAAGGPPEPAATLLDAVDAEASRLERMVTHLLDRDWIEAGEVDAHVDVVDLDDVVAAATASLSPPPELRRSLPSDLPAVHADPVLLERAVARLLADAVRRSPGSVAVEAGRVHGRVHLRVADQGDVVAATDRPTDGVTVARSFVEAMGGRLDVETAPGGGRSVVVDLPAASP